MTFSNSVATAEFSKFAHIPNLLAYLSLSVKFKEFQKALGDFPWWSSG